MRFEDLDAGRIQAAIPNVADVAFLVQGGQKRVYRCVKDGRPLALKVLKIETPRRRPSTEEGDGEDEVVDAATARARREVDILSRCDSPHVVKVTKDGLGAIQVEDLHLLYYFEEFIEGESLESLIATARLDESQLLTLAEHMTRAIDALWNCDAEHRIIHRDVKPANIMRRSSGEFVLLDAGLAYDVLQESISSSDAIAGTIQYLAPERLAPGSKRSLDFRVDMFALGVVLYEAATGRHPFAVPGITLPDLLVAITRSTPVDVRKVEPQVPEALGGLIMRLLAKRPHARFKSTHQLLTHICRLRGEGTR